MSYECKTPEGQLMRDFCSLLCHARGDFAGKPFHLEDWQAEYFDDLLGTKGEDGKRRYRRTFVALPRKSGKSAMLAALGLYMLLVDGEQGAEIIVAAGDRNQAALLHTAAKHFLESCPALARKCQVFRNSIVVEETKSTFMTVSSDAGLKHGLNPSVVLIDEYHVFRDSELVDVLETGMGARSQPLLAFITTAGNTIGGPCHRLWERARSIKEGTLVDPTFLPLIYEAEPDSDPFDIETAKACNPNYGITTKPEYFENWIARAKESPIDEVTYKTLHLNLWCTGADRWLKHGAYAACMKPLSPDHDTMPAYIGVDL